MGVRFIIGRAGSGKTHYCLEEVRNRLRRDPVDGPRIILLVPEQASLQMERALLTPEIPAAHRVEVLSFRRLAHKVLDTSGTPMRRALSDPARAMVLRHLLRKHADELEYYRRVDRLGGFIERLSATITEMIEEAVDPDELAASARRAGESDHVRAAKLRDLHLVYAAYLDYLGTDRVDPSQYLGIAGEFIPRCPWLNGAEMWVDGFASLSGQESMILIALARLCHHVDIAIMDDASPSATSSTPGAALGVQRLFRKTRQTYRDLHRALVDAGIAVEEPLPLHGAPSPRFCSSPSLAQLEQRLFASESRGPGGDGTAGGDVELVELPSRRVEVDYAVSRVMGWVQDTRRDLRYRDLAIIVRDLEIYHDLLSEALRARGVPFFIDRRRPIAHHPLVELLRGATAMAAEELSLGSVRSALKTGLLPIAIETADGLENYLLAHGLAGLATWSGEDWSFVTRSSFAARPQNEKPTDLEAEHLARVNQTRREFLRLVEPWLAFASASQVHTGKEWAAACGDWLNHVGIAETLKSWSAEAEADGDMDQAAEHEQVWRDTVAFLDDLAFAFADVRLTTEELSEVLEQGLAGLTLGLAPPMVDQLLVGSIERSRHPDIKAAIILGFNDGVFPAKLSEDSILNDDDRSALRESGIRMRPPSRDRVMDEAMLLYIALTRASQSVVVTSAAADNDGKLLRPSPYVDALREACPGLTMSRSADPVRSREAWDILSHRDLAVRLAMEFRARPLLDGDDPTVRGRWNELYDRSRAEFAQDPASRRALAALDEQNIAKLSPAAVERLIAGPLRTSVSQLETYAACPFQHFGRYLLKLRERAEAALAPVDVGQVHHAILDDLVRTLADRRQGFDGLSEGQLLQELNDSCARVATRLPGEGVGGNARDAYLLRRSAAQLARVVRAQKKASQAGSTRPRGAELSFGFGDSGALPALELSTPAGRRVLVRGFIDRVDLAELGDEILGIVIDYKRTPDKRLDMSRVYHGLSLQLPAYLLVLAEHGKTLAGRPVRPIAGLYVSLTPRYEVVEHPTLASSRDVNLEGTYRPRGLLLAERFEVLDNRTESGWSDWYGLYRKKDGQIGNLDSSDAVDAATFSATIDHVRGRLGELADGVLDGDISVRPYRLGTFSPCSWCALASVCRFEMGICDARFLETLKRSEVFRRLTGRFET